MNKQPMAWPSAPGKILARQLAAMGQSALIALNSEYVVLDPSYEAFLKRQRSRVLGQASQSVLALPKLV